LLYTYTKRELKKISTQGDFDFWILQSAYTTITIEKTKVTRERYKKIG